ncbi:MAG TPA: ribosome small subunit-dependent GTPase A [Aggregatilineales bacterium]|nr:ribosome small subunit-dependent GTPase A [Aggregatilineales bacterium]
MAREKNPVERFTKGLEKQRSREQNRKHYRYMRLNRDVKPPRRRDWIPENEDELENLSYVPDEPVMPPDELGRRSAGKNRVRHMDQAFTPDGQRKNEIDGILGRVVEVSSGQCRVKGDFGTVTCHYRGWLTSEETGFVNVIAVGDDVTVSDDGHGKFIVEQIHPRRSWLARPDPLIPERQQVIVANVDQLLIVSAWQQPPVWTELIDRFLVMAERDDLEALICLNKIDLAESESDFDEFIDTYGRLTEHVVLTSTVTGAGVEELGRILRGKTTVLAGLSGVGKSSLLTAVEPDFDLRISAVSDYRLDGQHTTTQAVMLPFGEDGYVIDTPGIREFGLAGMSRHDLAGFYPEFLDLIPRCRFSNCSHREEIDCAVRHAVEHGDESVPRWRYENYLKIFESLSG